MNLPDPDQSASAYSVRAPKAHLLYECLNAEEFSRCFEVSTGLTVKDAVDRAIRPSAPKAVFLTGSLPLGMATNGSDVDFVALVDAREAILPQEILSGKNTDQRLAFASDSDPLRAGLLIHVYGGITVEVLAVISSSIKRVYSRLRSRGPELSENEVMVLGRLRTGWLMFQSEEYLERNQVNLTDPALDVYSCTRNFVFSLIYAMKAGRALDLLDIPQALHLGRLSIEMAYLSFFASEGMPYLGAKWLAQLGHARNAGERISRHPLLNDGLSLLFPTYQMQSLDVRRYLQDVAQFQAAMKRLISRKTLFRIAFDACPQI